MKIWGFFVDPLGVRAAFVVDGTGHPADICRNVARKMGVRLDTKTGGVVGEMPLWAEKGEAFTVSNTSEVYPGLYVAGMAANNAFGGPRMGPHFRRHAPFGEKDFTTALRQTETLTPSGIGRARKGAADMSEGPKAGPHNVHPLLAAVRLYGFTPGGLPVGRDPLSVVADQIKGGVDVIQLREKEKTKRECLELGMAVRRATRENGVLFIVNDDVDLALILDADGVHLGQDDIPIR